jgi:tetratricopeptide (TPR) repeat protein
MSNMAPTRNFDTDWAAFVAAFLAHDRDAAPRLAILVDHHPHEPMAHIARGFALMLLARAELRPVAQASLTQAMECGLDARSADFANGLAAWLADDPARAVSCIERVIARQPLDAFAVKLSHAIRFMLGDAVGMRRSLARVVSIYTPDVPFAGFIKGCYAFALEETGDYREAERMGRAAVALQPADAWGRHAVAHVLEMEGRASDGLAWLGREGDWQNCSNFGFHLFWHRALFLIELGQVGEALALYDHGVRPQSTDDFRDIANAASLLQRLELEGLHVGERWEELADIAERRIDDRQLAFADLHYVMALAGAHRMDQASHMARGLLLAKGGHNAVLSNEIAAPVAEALIAFAQGRHRTAAALLDPVIPLMNQLGGSHAQRDVFQQVWLESLVRAGHPAADKRLGSRLEERRGRNAFAHERLMRAGLHGGHAGMALQLVEPTRVH